MEWLTKLEALFNAWYASLTFQQKGKLEFAIVFVSFATLAFIYSIIKTELEWRKELQK